MDKSIYNLIKQAIVTHSSKDVTIHDRPLATELIESEKKEDLFSPYDFLPKSYQGKKLILTRYVIYLGRILFLFFIGIIYAIYDLSHMIVTGEWKSVKLSDEFRKKKDPDNKWNNKLHTERWRGIQSSSGLNSLILVIVLTIAALMLVWGFHFLIKEVVLPDNNSRINSCGVVSIDQGCLEEQHFFLLNAATFWTNTGIAVTKGDKVYITASGSMYSDIDDMTSAAKENRKLRYPRSNFLGNYKKMDTGAEYCVYGRFPKDTIPVCCPLLKHFIETIIQSTTSNKPAFGSLLYQICDEIQGPQPYNTEANPKAVKQINFAKYRKDRKIEKRYRFEAEKSGLLYFTFNDVLLDDRMIDTIINNTCDTSLMYHALIKRYDKCSNKSISDTLKWLKDSVDSLIWFEDNFGEALINIRVVKNVSNSRLDCLQKTLVLFYRFQRWLYTDTERNFWFDFFYSGLLIMLLSFIGWFTLDVFISNRLNRRKEPDGKMPPVAIQP